MLATGAGNNAVSSALHSVDNIYHEWYHNILSLLSLGKQQSMTLVNLKDSLTRFTVFVQKYETSGLARIKPILNCGVESSME